MHEDFLQLRILDIISEAGNATTLVLTPTDGRTIPYSAGQFLTLLLTYNHHEVRRSYSLSSAPNEDPYLHLTIRRIENGEISRYLVDTLRVGDVLTSLYPAGRFTLDESAKGDLVLLGAGSGITPLFSMLKSVLSSSDDRRVTLLDCNTHERSIIFADQLAHWQTRYPDRFRLIHLLSQPTDAWTGLRGRLNNMLLERLLPTLTSDPTTASFYICGPFDFMRSVRITLIFAGVSNDQIRRELFTSQPVTPVLRPNRDTQIRLQYRGVAYIIDVPAHKSILQAALDQGIQLPYSCRGGRCSTCAARCLSGQVHMSLNEVLTERDLAEGWILTCTGYPDSDDVVIEV